MPVRLRLKNQVMVEVAHPRGRPLEVWLRRKAQRYLKTLELVGVELSVSLVTDRAIARLNRTWRKKDRPTDVLSFPTGGAPEGVPGPKVLGDVVISLDTAQRVARDLGLTTQAELERYLAHGLLHLLGHDHHTAHEAQAMRAEEMRLLQREGMVPEDWMAEAKRSSARAPRRPTKRKSQNA